MRVAKHAPRGPFQILECRHCLAEIVERGAVVSEERHRVNLPHRQRGLITLAQNASRHGYRFAHQRIGFFKAL